MIFNQIIPISNEIYIFDII